MRLSFHDPGRNLRSAAQISLQFFFQVLVLLLSVAVVSTGFSSAAQTSTQAPVPAPKKSRSSSPSSSSKAGGKTSGKTSGKSRSSKHSRSAGKSHSRERAQRAPTPERISEIQTALAGAGQYSGAPTSKWDAATVLALKRYQQAKGLPATGKLDAHTLQKLGLGSPITGASAPRPPATAPPAAPSSPTAPLF